MNHINKKKRGFTIIEIMVVIGAIALLASIVVVSVQGNIKKAETKATQETITSMEVAIGVCCANTQNILRTDIGQDMCSVSHGSLLPTASELRAQSATYTVPVGSNCSSTNPTLNIILTSHKNTACNSPNIISVRSTGTTYPAGCK